MKNIFEQEVTNEVISRIDALTAQIQPQWGKMNAPQMLAHLNVMYELVYEPEKFPKANGFEKFMIKLFAKNQVVGEKPYPKTVEPHLFLSLPMKGISKKKKKDSKITSPKLRL